MYTTRRGVLMYSSGCLLTHWTTVHDHDLRAGDATKITRLRRNLNWNLCQNGRKETKKPGQKCCLSTDSRRICRWETFENSWITLENSTFKHILCFRMYRSYDHAPTGLDQDQIPTPDKHHVPRSKVFGSKRLRKEDVPSGGNLLILERFASTNTCRDAKESMEVFHLWTISEAFLIW